MKIINDYPLIYDEIDAAFGVRKLRGVIFCWGDIIYAPGGGVITPSLIAHEEVHSRRQGSDVLGWWRRYIGDAEFRLSEEIPAHQAEYWHVAEGANRATRRRALKIVAKKLAAPLYGKIITLNDAKKIIAIDKPLDFV